jgi:hypothetical protein
MCWQRKGRDWKVTPGLTFFASGLVFFSSSHAAVIRVYDTAGNRPKRTSTRTISKSGSHEAHFHQMVRSSSDCKSRVECSDHRADAIQ